MSRWSTTLDADRVAAEMDALADQIGAVAARLPSHDAVLRRYCHGGHTPSAAAADGAER